MSKNSVEFGWAAAPMKEQHPVLPDDVAEHFDKDNEALTRLYLRGYLTHSQKMEAVSKITKRIGAAIREALASREVAP